MKQVKDRLRSAYYDRKIETLEGQLDEALIKIRHLEKENAVLAKQKDVLADELSSERQAQFRVARERSWGF